MSVREAGAGSPAIPVRTRADVPSFTLNGTAVSLEGIDPHETLLELARGQGYTSVKEGCAEGDCGACTVAVRQTFARGSTYRAVVSCLTLAGQLPGVEAWTAEALSPAPLPDGTVEDLHPLQAAIADGGGTQCGYCTPGFAMSLFAAYYTAPRPGAAPEGDPAGEVLAGNLCRCTGYRALREAATALAGAGVGRSGDPFWERLARPMPPRPSVSVEGRDVIAFRPSTIDEAIQLKIAHPEARIVAGATDVGVEVSRGGRRFPAFIMLGAVDQLRDIGRDDTGLRIGAGVTIAELKVWVSPVTLPLVHRLLPWFGSRQIRNRATVGGNLMTASPVGDLSVAWLALDAKAVVQARTGTRTVPISRFFTGYRQTVVGPDELLMAVRVPPVVVPPGGRRVEWAHKVARRDRVDISTVVAAFTVTLNDRGVVTDARLAYGGVAPVPARAARAESALVGASWDADGTAAARAVLATEFAPIDDVRASVSYRARLVTNLFDRCVAETSAP